MVLRLFGVKKATLDGEEVRLEDKVEEKELLDSTGEDVGGVNTSSGDSAGEATRRGPEAGPGGATDGSAGNKATMLQKVLDAAPLFYDLYGGEVFVGVADTEKILWAKDSKHMSFGLKPGSPLVPGMTTYEAAVKGVPVRKFVGVEESRFGFPYIGISLPIRESDGRVSGVISVTSSMHRQQQVKEMSEELESAVGQMSSAGQSVAEAATSLAATTEDLFREVESLVSELGVVESAIQLIEEVAQETHLLGLNAQIEAARAGEHGRGFAVVAAEIRNMATRVRENVKKTAQGLRQISSAVQKMADSFGNINTMAQNQAAASEEISAVIAGIKENAARLREVSEEVWV